MSADTKRWEDMARELRRTVIRMTARARSAHVGTSLSMIELLVVLYTKYLRIDPKDLEHPDRDRFILSKGHGCAALYAMLAERGFFPEDWLDTFYQNGSELAGHSTHNVPGVEISTGSLGHGLPMAVGMALVGHRDRRPFHVYCMLSDGECDEGSNWEAALFAGHHKLKNLTVIIDNNKIQGIGHTRDVMNLEPLADKWLAFNWDVREIDGHDLQAIDEELAERPAGAERPRCIVANTVKGKGVSFMENTVLWHYRAANDEELNAALAELEPSK